MQSNLFTTQDLIPKIFIIAWKEGFDNTITEGLNPQN